MVILETGNEILDSAFRLALGDISGNIIDFEGGLLEGRHPVLIAGSDYPQPWTRDSSINIYNGASLLYPEVMRNNLLALVERRGGGLVLGDLPGGEGEGVYEVCQSWDAIIWLLGVWHHYLYTGDRGVLELAYEVMVNSLGYYIENEYDEVTGLFRGGGVYADGISAYGDYYSRRNDNYGDISGWPRRNPDLSSVRGHGLPMFTLSLNCLYYHIFNNIAGSIARASGRDVDSGWWAFAEQLRRAINDVFWDDAAGRYCYYVDGRGRCDRQEGLGVAFSLLFGVAGEDMAVRLFENVHSTKYGLPCLWPVFERYKAFFNGGSEVEAGQEAFGRHCGTVWPFIGGFWGVAGAKYKRADILGHELFALAGLACLGGQFREIYHPQTGDPYGGLQEAGGEEGFFLLRSVERQTWSATAFFNMVLGGLLGMRFSVDGVRFEPVVPEQLVSVEVRGLPYRSCELDIFIKGSGSEVGEIELDGRDLDECMVPADIEGSHRVNINMVI